MKPCAFCGRKFINSQAVRAHLKACPEYSNNLPKAMPKAEIGLPKAKKTEEAEPNPVSQMRDRVLAERLRLELRQAEAEHRRLDEEMADRERMAKEARERERRQALDRERAERESLLAEERREKTRRLSREKIRRAKDAAFGVFGSFGLPKEAEAKARIAIERELSGLPVHDLPQGELDEIARGIRDHVLAPYRRIQKQREEAEARRRGAEDERRARKFALTVKKAGLISDALDYAQTEWEINPLDWFEVKQEIETALEREISGDESEADVRDLVDEVVGG